ncbi:hypothetical protein II5_01044 [Bacillus cereus MSX-A1]|uniref:hypothetical protein n=1 Tax=Bacillus cereus TaxID=1396 RepID=UPI0002796735|nr:hypothetical protein [Bacillus cereus]EJR08762.1 hypothetical protein II5_01044 [Bacillus cereus MSX-A1]MDR4289723.1 hypothetical protein [Bacillus cereus]
MVVKKVKLIEKKLEEGKLSVNEARLLLDLEPLEVKQCDKLFVKFDNETGSKVIEVKPLFKQDLHKVSDTHAK